jgi:hypothetical protein
MSVSEILLYILGGAISIIVYFLKEMRQELKANTENIGRNKGKIENLQTEQNLKFQNIQTELNFSIQNMNQKIDHITENIHRIFEIQERIDNKLK